MSWTNNPDNDRYYNHVLYSEYLSPPDQYYINITCHLPNNSKIEVSLYNNASIYKTAPPPFSTQISVFMFLICPCLYVQTGRVFYDEGETDLIDQELPIGSDCVMKGAATPTNGPAHCLDPLVITYSNTSCLTTGI